MGLPAPAALLLAATAAVIAFPLPVIAKEPVMHTQANPVPFPASVQPLAEAVARGDLPAIAALATPQALEQTGQDQVTLLEWAIWNQQSHALAALLRLGADPAAPGMDGESVAHLAASVDDPRYLQVLIEHGAPIDIAGTRGGRTPIFRAVQSRRDPQVRLLLAAGADIGHADAMGNTLLHVAAEVNDAARVLQLLQRGAPPQARNQRGDDFQPALFAGADARLSAQGRSDRQAVRDWLAANVQHP